MRIAVVVPAFNVADFLRDTIVSVLSQTLPDWTLTIIDDGSTDATGRVARDFDDLRIRVIGQQNAGVSAARNRGICAAGDADAFLFLDGDDWLAPDALATLAKTLQDAPWAVAACGRYARVSPYGATRRSPAPPDGCVLEPLLTRNLFVNGGHLLIRRDAVETAGLFRTDLSYGEDWEYWVRLALLGEIAAVQSRVPVLFVRDRPESAYRTCATELAAWRPAMAAIHGNPAVAERLGIQRSVQLRQRAEAEAAWTIGRELIRHGRPQEGQRWLRSAVWRAPGLKRFGMMLMSRSQLGPFRPYTL